MMNNIRLTSRRRLCTLLGAALLAALGAVGCNLNQEQWEAIEPQAEVWIVPNTFCIGETLTVAWDGGPQVGTCGSSPNVGDCKGAGVIVLPNLPLGLSVPFGFDDYNLNGSSSGPADFLVEVIQANQQYEVEFELWTPWNE
jgi:hypothetical protein